MKKAKFVLALVILCSIAVLPLQAQSKHANAMSLNGVTGLYVVPSANLGWNEGTVGLNGGYHMNFVEGKLNDLFHVNVSLLKMLEFSGTYDAQPADNDDDLLLGAKFRLPISGTSIALGGNFQYGDIGRTYGTHWTSQVYGVVTYQAQFFSAPAQTSLVIGKSFYEGRSVDSSIDFGMGFDVIVLPKYLKNFVHWLVDFANFGYNNAPSTGFGYTLNQATLRGTVNTGLRFDLSQISVFSKINFVIDAYLTDAFDADSRYFGIGAMIGTKF